jgi:ComF family protein
VSGAWHAYLVEVAIRVAARAVGRLIDLAMPATCAGCGREGDILCAPCRPALRARAEVPAGTPIGLPSETPVPLLQLEWCAPFSGSVRRLLHGLKYAGELRGVEPLAAAMAERWRHAGAGGDTIVHVPVHRERRRERGYDQAERLATATAALLGMRQLSALERTRATTAQFQLGRSSRAANVQGAFRLVHTLPPQAVAGHWFVLVDDVVTTGATLAACAGVLLDAGALGVSALTVARER